MDKDLLIREKEELELQINNLIKSFMNKTGLNLCSVEVNTDPLDKFNALRLKFTL